MINKTFNQLADELHAELVRYYGSETVLACEFYATAVNDAINAMAELNAAFEELDRKIKSGEIIIIDGRISRLLAWIKVKLTSRKKW